MSKCGSCCGQCGGSGGAMELAAGEVRMLQKLGQIPFLPVARRMDDDVPVYLEDSEETARDYSLILRCLEKRGLISIDYDMPLTGFDDSVYAAYPIRGSFSLTSRGQQVLELLEYQGIE